MLNDAFDSTDVNPNDTYTLRVIKSGNEIIWEVNNVEVIKYIENDPAKILGGGYFALRLMNPAMGLYDNIKVYDLDQNALSVSEVDSNIKKSIIFPNPISDVLTIKSKSINNWTIYSPTGKAIFSEDKSPYRKEDMFFNSANYEYKRIDVSNLSKGFYFIKVDNEVHSFIKK